MKQGNGMDLLGPSEPRGTEVGIIYVSPTDDRQSVLAAIIVQEKLGRKQVAIVLPKQNKAFRDHRDFEDLKSHRRKFHTQIIIVAPDAAQAGFARQRRFDVYSSLENYASALRLEFKGSAQQKRNWLFGSQRFKGAPDKSGADEQDEEQKPDAVGVVPGIPGGHAALAGAAGFGAGMFAADLEHGTGATPSSVPSSSGPVDLPDDYDFYHTAMDDSDIEFADEDDYALAPDGPSEPSEESVPASATGVAAGAFAVAQASSTPPSSPEPHIIELPVRGRNTAKLPPRPDLEAWEVAEPEPPRRNTSKVAAGAALAARSSSGGSQPPLRGGDNSGGGGGRRPQRRRRVSLWVAILLLLGIVVLVAAVLASLALNYPSGALASIAGMLPKGGPTAVIAVTPDSKVIANSYIILAVPGQADPNQLQITARQLTSSPQSQTKNIKATEHNKTNGTAATGMLTFINGSNVPKTIPVGQIIPVGNGVSMITTVQANMPASNLVTGFLGKATVPAHASAVGDAGNLRAGAINTACCTANNDISVVNNAAFTGGQDPKDYNFVNQNGFDVAVTALSDQLTKQANSELSSQLKATEQLAAASQCPATVSKNNKVGDQGVNVDSVDLTVSVTCKAVAYDQTGMQGIVMSHLQAKAAQDLGVGYALQGNIIMHSSVQKLNADNSVSLLVDSKGLWVYQCPNGFKDQVAGSVAGKALDQARTQLRGQKGVANVTVTASSNTLPTDPKQIEVVIQAVLPIKDTTPNPPVNPPPTGQDTPQPGNG